MSESSQARLSRLLALVPWLKNHNGIRLSQAAEHFGVSVDQLTRDLWQLVVCGIPGYGPDQLIDIQFWDDDQIDVIDAMQLDRPLRLSSDEATALTVALQVLHETPGAHNREAIASARVKLETATGSAVSMAIAGTSSAGTIDAVSRALAANTALEISYQPGDRDAEVERRIQPISQISVDNQSYLEAWCSTTQSVRTFRIDRIRRTSPIDPLVGSDRLQELMARSKNGGPQVTLTSATRATIAVHPKAQWVWDTDPVEADGGCWAKDWTTGSITYASPGWLARYVMSRLGCVVVIAPHDARRFIHEWAVQKMPMPPQKPSAPG